VGQRKSSGSKKERGKEDGKEKKTLGSFTRQKKRKKGGKGDFLNNKKEEGEDKPVDAMFCGGEGKK